MLLAACAKDDAPQPAPETGAQFSIAIFDAGYAPAGGVRPADSNTMAASETGTAAGAYVAPATRKAGAPAADAPITRAAENGYATEFMAGDRCGLYIVRGGTVTAANVRLTASAGQNGSVAWTPDASAGTLWHTPGDRYFVYYPWQAAPQGAPTVGQTVDADDDGAFFAALIDAWEPAADQSDYVAGYTASDLMTAEATVGASSGGSVPLVFAMTHRMALAVVELPGTVYTFTNEGIADYTVPLAAAFGGEAQPCRMADHTYRYLVNPAATLPTLEGSYIDDTQRGFSINSAGIAGGRYKTYQVDGGTVTKQHTLQVGDYFLSDGHLLAKDADPATVQAAEVVGIVFQTDPARIGEGEKEALGGTVHGLVVATKAPEQTYMWFHDGATYVRDETEVGMSNIHDENDYVATFMAADADIEGYRNNKIIREKRATDYAAGYYPAFKAAGDFEGEVAAPAATTGWYLPSNGQWFDILRGLGGAVLNTERIYNFGQGDPFWISQFKIVQKMNDVSQHVQDKTAFVDQGFYWSSSAASSFDARVLHFDSTEGTVYCITDYKGHDIYVRPVLAF